MSDYQMDIFGNAVAVNEIATKTSESIKSRFRKMYGFDYEHECRDCKYLTDFCNRGKSYYKCVLMGISASEATDIRLKDTACTQWERKEE